MTTAQRVHVAPAVLRWARESISLDQRSAAKRLGVSEATIQAWESGDKQPTLNQLRLAADKYKRPLSVLLLPAPPKDFDAMRDFRQKDVAAAWSPDLHGEFRRALQQREVVLELAEIAPESVSPMTEVPSIELGTDAELGAESLRSFLGIDLATQFAWSDQYEALNAWVSAVEAKGIVVIHTDGVALSEMRGFSVSELPFPVIALNGSDFPRGRVFTLLHELAHLGVNLGGLCDLHEVREGRIESDRDRLEHFCNQVAASTLMPANGLLADANVSNATPASPWSLAELEPLSRRFNVSSEALLLRLITLKKASWETYWERKAELEIEYERARENRRRKSREGAGGGSYYRTKARNLGHGYAHAVIDAFDARALTSMEVADALRIKYNQLPKLERELR